MRGTVLYRASSYTGGRDRWARSFFYEKKVSTRLKDHIDATNLNALIGFTRRQWKESGILDVVTATRGAST